MKHYSRNWIGQDYETERRVRRLSRSQTNWLPITSLIASVLVSGIVWRAIYLYVWLGVHK